MNDHENGTATTQTPFPSRLSDPVQRFLVQIVEHGFTCGLRAPDEFLRHFPAMTIMQALAEHPTRRARILEETVGLRPRVALRKSAMSAGDDLQIAVDEGETNAAAILGLFEPDDRIRFLDRHLIWAYVVEPRYWTPGATLSVPMAIVQEHTTFIISQALAEGLLVEADIINAISVASLVEYLSRDAIASMLARALAEGRNERPFTDAALLSAAGIHSLVERVPLSLLWESVIAHKIASPHGLVGEGEPLFDEAEAHPDAPDARPPTTPPSSAEPRGATGSTDEP